MEIERENTSFCFLDGEEYGKIGSNFFIKNTLNEQFRSIRKIINVDCLGGDILKVYAYNKRNKKIPIGGDHKIFYNNLNCSILSFFQPTKYIHTIMDVPETLNYSKINEVYYILKNRLKKI